MATRKSLFALLVPVGLLAGGYAAWRYQRGVQPETAHAAPLATIPATVAPVETGEWLAAHFKHPVAAQGPPPAGATEIEASLRPEACGACHVQQYADWKASWHALGMGPGLFGQFPLLSADDRARCERCHAPLAEQAGNDELGAEGLTCAGCHVREHVRYGPPKDTAPIEGAPHHGFVARDEFRSAAFCVSCHDFRPTSSPVEGKLIQETTEEWRRTQAAADGKTCQACHMPGGRHLWKGIHDPDMVKQAFDADARFISDGLRLVGKLVVTATGAGHRFPTYVTPEVWLRVDQVDADGLAIEGTRVEAVIGRRVNIPERSELFDTRLLPGESKTLLYDDALHPESRAIVAKVEVWPDAAYERVYEGYLDDDWGNATLIAEALANGKSARFVAWEERVELPE